MDTFARLGAFCALIVLLGGAGVASGQGTVHGTMLKAQTTTPQISQYGNYAFGAWGYPNNLFEPFPVGFTYSRIKYRIPPRLAHEGRKNWYLIHLHYRAKLDTSHRGRAVFAVATDEIGCAYIAFNVHPNAKRRVEVTTSGWIRGLTKLRTNRSRIAGRFSNFLAQLGVQGGTNTLQFILSQGNQDVVKRLVIYKDSSIERSKRGPAMIALGASAPRVVMKGQRFSVSAQLRNIGDRSARHVTIVLSKPPKAIRPLGRRKWLVSALAPHHKTVHRFRLRAISSGRFRLSLGGMGNSNNQVALVSVSVR
jgi:hypothetical protein